MKLTESQHSFLYRAAQLDRHDMGISPRGFFQTRMAEWLAEVGFLKAAGMGIHEETGNEAEMWRITPEGLAHLGQGMKAITRMTEETGGYDKERAEAAKKP